MITKARLNEQGRVVIPAEFREAAGFKPGDEVVIEVIGKGELRLRTKRQSIRRAQDIVARGLRSKRDLAAELIEDRRKEASRG